MWKMVAIILKNMAKIKQNLTTKKVWTVCVILVMYSVCCIVVSAIVLVFARSLLCVIGPMHIASSYKIVRI